MLLTMQQEVVEAWNDVFKEDNRSKDDDDEGGGLLAKLLM